MVSGNPDAEARKLLKQLQQAKDSGEAEKVLEALGRFITQAEQSGAIDRAKSTRMRLDLAAAMLMVAPQPRERVTLSLPRDVAKALRLASAEMETEMSKIVEDALRDKLTDLPLASQALQKKK